MKYDIPFYNLDQFYSKLETSIIAVMENSLKDGYFLDGNETDNLEKELKLICKRKYATITGSGSDAIFLALKALDIKAKDEVLVPAISFISTATSITRAGAHPIFVDVKADNVLIDLNDAASKITPATKAIMIVDLYGNMPDVKAIEDFANTHNLILVEDAAQALGSEIHGKPAGCIGDISILSFDPSKPIGAFGTGGAVLTDKPEYAHFCYAARQNGKNPDTGEYDQFGINSRMSETQAALVNWQLESFENTLKIRQQKAKYLIEQLKNLPLQILVNEQTQYSGNFHKIVIACKNRDDLMRYLNKNNIETRVHYRECLYQHPVLKESSCCLNAEILTQKLLTLPFYPELETEDIDYISQTMHNYFK